MAAQYPSSIPDLAALILSDPMGFEKFTRLIEEMQATLNTLGTNPQGLKGTVTNRLASVDALAVAFGDAICRNLHVKNNSTTPDTKLDVTADKIAIEGAIAESVSLTVDLTAVGKNGRTAPSRATNTWYYLWLGLNPSTGEVCGILDDEYVRANLNLTDSSLAGFTFWRRVNCRRTDASGSGNFYRGAQQDNWMWYDTQLAIVLGASATGGAWNTHDTSTAVPAVSRLCRIFMQLNVGVQGTKISLRRKDTGVATVGASGVVRDEWTVRNSADNGSVTIGTSPWATWDIILNAAREYEWQTNNSVTGNGSTVGVFLGVQGYYDSI